MLGPKGRSTRSAKPNIEAQRAEAGWGKLQDAKRVSYVGCSKWLKVR